MIDAQLGTFFLFLQELRIATYTATFKGSIF